MAVQFISLCYGRAIVPYTDMAALLKGRAPEAASCISFLNALPLPCRASRPRQAEVTLPSFPPLSWPDFAWLMNCDRTQLQGCLCSFLFAKFFQVIVWKIVQTLVMTLTLATASSGTSRHPPAHTWRTPTATTLLHAYNQMLLFG